MRVATDLYDETNTLSEDQLLAIQELVHVASDMENISEGTELSITFVDNERIKEINREYRDKDAVTDVISFALNEQVSDEVEIVGGEIPNLLGDIIISIPRATEQAKSYNHSFEREIGFLVVHGILHLLGYDHMTEEEEKQMFSRQKEILAAYGLER
ncbi:rRNA maturation RNase YbeY [Desertibacillus haloalkaliphilus]|uniref:rRNA maturation RNase YbeY n=1 Tax=Desertibacillus haloalkaliphilus TaxID=1328930 RepID=UPI001C2554D0|nr:rRNA maturation RNase YbeY [Desertibacillus haloalkaliphilus]